MVLSIAPAGAYTNSPSCPFFVVCAKIARTVTYTKQQCVGVPRSATLMHECALERSGVGLTRLPCCTGRSGQRLCTQDEAAKKGVVRAEAAGGPGAGEAVGQPPCRGLWTLQKLSRAARRLVLRWPPASLPPRLWPSGWRRRRLPRPVLPELHLLPAASISARPQGHLTHP